MDELDVCVLMGRLPAREQEALASLVQALLERREPEQAATEPVAAEEDATPDLES